MKRVTLWCPSCGTKLEADAGEARVTCTRCGITFPVGEDVQQRAAGETAATRTDAADSVSRRQNEEATEGPQTSEEEERRARESRERRDEALRAWEQKQRDAEQRRLETDARHRVEEEKKNKKTANLYGYILVFGVFGLMLLFILFYRPASAPSAGTGESSERPAAEQTDSGKVDEQATREKASDGEAAPKEEDKSEASKGYIDLQKGVLGDYGQEVAVDVRFVGRVTDIAYHVPPGSYAVKNCGIYPVELDAYNGTTVGADGVAELGSLAGMSNIKSGETRYIEVIEGWVLAITSNAGHVALVPEGSDVSVNSIKVDDGVNVIDSCGRQLKEYCYGLVAATYPNEDVNWNMGSWGWKFNVWDTDGSIDAQLNVPTADGRGYVHSVWIMLTPEMDGKIMTGGTCHFISFDYIGRYTGDPVPEEHVYDEKGQPYRDRLDAVVRDTLGI